MNHVDKLDVCSQLGRSMDLNLTVTHRQSRENYYYVVNNSRWQSDHCVSPNPHPHSDLLHLECPVTRSAPQTEITFPTTDKRIRVMPYGEQRS